MYEYVQTAKGWVLYWGGAPLYREKKPEALAAAAPQAAPGPKTAEDGRQGPALAQAA